MIQLPLVLTIGLFVNKSYKKNKTDNELMLLVLCVTVGDRHYHKVYVVYVLCENSPQQICFLPKTIVSIGNDMPEAGKR